MNWLMWAWNSVLVFKGTVPDQEGSHSLCGAKPQTSLGTQKPFLVPQITTARPSRPPSMLGNSGPSSQAQSR